MSESNQERALRKLTEEVYNLSKNLRAHTKAIQENTEAVKNQGPQEIFMEEPAGGVTIEMTAQAAVATMRSICQDADDCERGHCPIYDWCQEFLPPKGAASAPRYWELPAE